MGLCHWNISVSVENPVQILLFLVCSCGMVESVLQCSSSLSCVNEYMAVDSGED